MLARALDFAYDAKSSARASTFPGQREGGGPIPVLVAGNSGAPKTVNVGSDMYFKIHTGITSLTLEKHFFGEPQFFKCNDVSARPDVYRC